MKYGLYTGPKLKMDIISGLGSAHPVSRLCLLGGTREKQALPESCQALEDTAAPNFCILNKDLNQWANLF